MTDNLKEIRSIDDLNRALEESNERLVLFFKHSLTCPISARAYREFQSYLQKSSPGVSANLITVQTARSVSDEAAARLRLEHHSPQAILVRNGREMWNASHFAITAAALQDAVNELSD
jgi:bacillithiol system protein YtxJ